PSTIFMPATAPFPKVAATRGYGAAVVLVGAVFDDCLSGALAHAERTGATFVSPFDDPLVIAGQGTIGLELAEQAPEAGTVVVAVGGGGLISGVAAALKALRPGIRVIGVEAEGAASRTASLAAAWARKVPGGPGEPVCLVLSGGNIDPTLLIRVIRHGLTAAGRYLLLRVTLDDRPGELHRLAGVLAGLGLNVVDIEHHRSGVHLAVGEVEVHMTTETRDPERTDEVLAP